MCKWCQATVIRYMDSVRDRDSCGWDRFSAYAEDLRSKFKEFIKKPTSSIEPVGFFFF